MNEEIEQLADEPLHEGRNDERTERCRSSTWGLAVLFAREAEPEVNAKVKAASRRRSHWCRPRRGNGRRNGCHHSDQASNAMSSSRLAATGSILRKENQAGYLRF